MVTLRDDLVWFWEFFEKLLTLGLISKNNIQNINNGTINHGVISLCFSTYQIPVNAQEIILDYLVLIIQVFSVIQEELTEKNKQQQTQGNLGLLKNYGK